MTAFSFMKKGDLPIVLQAERSECALACLAMVLNFHGHKVDLTTLRMRARISQQGLTLKSLVNLGARLNLAARPLRLEISELAKLSLPAILHWNLDHFVVLKNVGRRGMVIHNPAIGRQKFSWQEAGKHFTGIALELTPTADFGPLNEIRKLPFSALWKSCTSLAGDFIQLLSLSLLLQLFALSLPFYTQIIIDDVLVSHDADLLKLLAAGFILLIVFRQLTQLLRARVVLYLGNKVSFHFATSLCRHLLHLPQDYFSRRHLGDIVSRFGSLNKVRDFICSGLVEIVVDGMMTIGTLVLMCIYDLWLTFIALVGVLLYGLIRLATYRKLQEHNEAWINDMAVENTQFMENVSAIQGIKLSGREAFRLAAWQNCYMAAINSGIKVQVFGINLNFANGLLAGIENILLLLVGAYAVMGGALSIGMLMAFISFKDHFYRSIFSLLDKYFELKLLDVHLSRLADIAFSEPEFVDHEYQGKGSVPEKAKNIMLENIAYRYDADSPMLFEDISLKLSGNDIVAVIGPTGCGKSTLLKIVASLVTPEQGTVMINGKSVKQMGLENFRVMVSGVMQNDILLSGSIMENITFFDPTPDHEKAYEAAELACIADDIDRMPMQYHTMVGNMGSALSGGQVQRILLARAIYQKPAFLVLDEATSHLDIRTESRINKSLKKLEIPCLMVAHRPETVLHADRIYCLEKNGLKGITRQDFQRSISK
jgi:ATP-binding cassette, subfamily B, bacterial CvaB/MchF/RaxB